MIKSITDAATLQNGVKMPWLGLGVFMTEEGEQVVNAVKYALKAGYRHIDTAAIYRNETGVGQAIREAGVPREDLFVTTKLWNSEQGYESTLKAFDESLEKLGLDYVDLYLIHWPVKFEDDSFKYKETWRAFETLYKQGRVKAIGVSNFKEHHLDDLIKDAEIKPMVNQVELHPYLTQTALRSYCNEHNIVVTAWSPIMKGEAGNEPVLVELAEKYGKTPTQVVLRWHLQSGIIAIPKSVREERIVANADLYDFELSAEDIAKIDALNKDHRYGPDPDAMKIG
jgi:methylglyoxal/glyoxal reductase